MSSLLQLAGSSTAWSSRAHAGRTCHPPPGPTVSEGPSVPRPRRGMRTVRVSVREATTLGALRCDLPVPPLRDVCGHHGSGYREREVVTMVAAIVTVGSLVGAFLVVQYWLPRRP